MLSAVTRGSITSSPWFGQLGLGTQYELPDSVGNLIENGYLKLAEDGG